MNRPKPRKKMSTVKDEVDYYDHQISFIRRGALSKSFILADEMGLGKSLQSMTIAAIAFAQEQVTRVLVVSPASIKENWNEEFKKFLLNVDAEVLDGTPTKRNKQLAEFSKQVLIVNYEQIGLHHKQLAAMDFGICIADEAHGLKNRKAARTKAYVALRPYIPRHFLLTGSPILGHVDDLWQLLNIVAPREFPDFWRFVNRYAVWGGYNGKEVVGVKNEKELRERISPFLVRREKKECLDLPDKVITQIKLPMHPEQEKLYKQVKEELRVDNPVDPNNPREIPNGLAQITLFKQICGTTATVDGYKDFSSKLDKAEDMAEEILGNGSPLVMFTQYRPVQLCMASRLEAKNIPVWMVHGDIPINKRNGVLDAWKQASADGQHGVLICMYQVAGVGFNMVEANNLIVLDKLWVPKLNEQAYDRLHRIGQTKTVYIWELIIRNSIEQRIEQINKMKSKVFEGVLGGQPSSAWMKKLLDAEMNDEEPA